MKWKTLSLISLAYLTIGVPLAFVLMGLYPWVSLSILSISLFVWDYYIELV